MRRSAFDKRAVREDVTTAVVNLKFADPVRRQSRKDLPIGMFASVGRAAGAEVTDRDARARQHGWRSTKAAPEGRVA
jgi:hypothetical protein